MSLIKILKGNPEARKIFGEKEIKIIEKQLWGMALTQSEKNRLSRDIRKKFSFIKEVAKVEGEFTLKHGKRVNEIIDESKEIILNHHFFGKIKQILLFGSIINKEHNLSSDIDIAIEFKKITKEDASKFIKEMIGKLPSEVDIKVYNILPLKIRKSIDKEKKVIYERKVNG